MASQLQGKRDDPLVTVLLPVRNGEPWISDCLASLADQTFRDFEVLLVDDGCTDKTTDIARTFDLPALRIIEGPQQGLARALALGVQEARGRYIARQDHDDVSHPERLERQVRHMEAHPRLVALGSQARVIDEDSNVQGLLRRPTGDQAIRLRMKLFNPFVHTSVIFRRTAVLQAGNYQSPGPRPYPEDYDLWSRLVEHGELGNLDEYLVDYRRTPSSVTLSHREVLAEASAKIAVKNATKSLNHAGVPESTMELLGFFHRRKRQITPLECVRIQRMVLVLIAQSGWRAARQAAVVRALVAPVGWTLRPPNF